METSSIRYMNQKYPNVAVYIPPVNPKDPEEKPSFIRFSGGVSPTITDQREMLAMEKVMETDRTFSRLDEMTADPEENLSEFRCSEEGCQFSTSTQKKLKLHLRLIHGKKEG